VKRESVLIISLLLLSLSILSLKSSIRVAQAPTVYSVHNLDTGINYTAIQEAINANETLDGHRILVDAGTYYERITINKSISLLGAGKEKTIIDGNRTSYYRGSDSILYITANSVSISNLTVQNAGGNEYWDLAAGICLSSNNNRMTDNMIRANNFGLEIGDPYGTSVSNNTIQANIIQGNNYGIFEYMGTNNRIVNNTVTANSEGIWFAALEPNAANNTVSENLVSENGEGIRMDDSILIGGQATTTTITEYSLQAIIPPTNSSRISQNTIYHNGVGISISSSNNVIEGNTIERNTCGLSYLYVDPISASPNYICQNNFLANTNQTAINNLRLNNWDNGIEGNYWSDYYGTDANYDGIGDTPYVIEVNNTDNYPLMGIFSDFNITPEEHVTTVCNSTLSDFQFNGTAIIFNVTGVEGTSGFCRIRIPTSLMNATYKVFVNGTEVAYSLLPCSDSTYSYLYFNYTHSKEAIVIVPELSSFCILTLYMIATLLLVVFYRKRIYKGKRTVSN
jgi:nitrous oxidase accessory protein